MASICVKCAHHNLGDLCSHPQVRINPVPVTDYVRGVVRHSLNGVLGLTTDHPPPQPTLVDCYKANPGGECVHYAVKDPTDQGSIRGRVPAP